MGGINLEYKPKTYFGPQSLLKYRIEQVKGAVVREKLGMLLNEGRIRELETLLDSEDISTASIKSLGSMHPMFMGGVLTEWHGMCAPAAIHPTGRPS